MHLVHIDTEHQFSMSGIASKDIQIPTKISITDIKNKYR